MPASGTFTRAIVASLDRIAELLRRPRLERPEDTAHEVGRAGEELAYFELRRRGYTVVARNWRNPRRRGELDLVAWDGPVLCFVEVKTRTKKSFVPAEAAVHREKMHELMGMAKLYLRRQARGTRFRFDVVSVYLVPGAEPEVALFKDAFGWKERAN